MKICKLDGTMNIVQKLNLRERHPSSLPDISHRIIHSRSLPAKPEARQWQAGIQDASEDQD